MRLRTLIELLAALILTFAALIAISKMPKATGLKVENACTRATIGEAKTNAVCMTLNVPPQRTLHREAEIDPAIK
jgi:copper(I)-binding protein